MFDSPIHIATIQHMQNFEDDLPLYVVSLFLHLQVSQPFYGELRIKQSFIPHSDSEFSACGIYGAMTDNG
jgi:hypothetical protein